MVVKYFNTLLSCTNSIIDDVTGYFLKEKDS